MEAKHTPTPWSANVVVSDGGGWKNPEQYVTIGTDDVHVAYYSTGFAEFPPDEVNKANADFIVRACNSHDALVEALKHARDEIASFPRSLGYAITALPKIAAALALAGETP